MYSGEGWNEQDQAELDAFVPEQGQGDAPSDCIRVIGAKLQQPFTLSGQERSV